MMEKSSVPPDRESLQKDINTIIRLLGSEEKSKEDCYNSDNEVWLKGELVVDLPSEGVPENIPGELGVEVTCTLGDGTSSGISGPQNESCIGEFIHIPEDGNVLTIMPDTPELCLILNQAYQGMIHESIVKLEAMLESNKEHQRLVQEELDECRKRGKPVRKTRLRSRPITLFAAPYFRDVNHCIPPSNEDTKLKERTMECNAYTAPPRPWLSAELKRLSKAVQANAKQLAMEPLMTRKEYLCEKLDNDKLSRKEEENLKEKLKATELELKKINDMPDRNLLEPQGQRLDWMKISAVDMEGQKSAEECELMWINYLHPSINKEKWTQAEDERLKQIAEKRQYRDWDSITQELKTNRTAIQCLERFQSELNLSLQKGPWSKEEDEILKAVIETCRIGNYIPWNLVAYYVEGRNRSQILNRWTRSLQPGIKKGGWSREEDVALVAAVKKYGPRWNIVKDFLPGRTNYQCRERYSNSLDENLRLCQWSKEEDRALVKLVKKYGAGRWTTIAKYIPGRTDNMVLQRYKTISNHRPDIFIPSDHSSLSDENSEDSTEEEETKALAPTQYSARVMNHRSHIFSSVQNAVVNILGKIKQESKTVTFKEHEQDNVNLMILKKAILPSQCRRPRRVTRFKSEEELAVDAVLDALFTPAVACSNKRKKHQCIAHTKKRAEEYNSSRSLIFEALKSEDPKINISTDENSDEEKEFQENSDMYSVAQVVEQFILGAYEENEIPVFPPSFVSLEAFKILLVGRKRLAMASQLCNSLDVVLSLHRWGKKQQIHCQSCRNAASLSRSSHFDAQNELNGDRSYNSDNMSHSNYYSEEFENSSQIEMSELNSELHMKMTPERTHPENTSNGIYTENLDTRSPYKNTRPATHLHIKEEIETIDTQSAKRKLDPSNQDCPQVKRCHKDYPADSAACSDIDEFTLDSSSTEVNEDSVSYVYSNRLCLKCERIKAFQRSFTLLQKRFVSLFFWPALMSAIKPEECLEDAVLVEESNDPREERKLPPKKKSLITYVKKRKHRKPWIAALFKKKYGVKEDVSNLPSDRNSSSSTQASKHEVNKRHRRTKRKPNKRTCKPPDAVNPETLRRSARQAAKMANAILQVSASDIAE